MKIATIVLAAGRSRRMGRPKAWLSYQGKTFLQRIVETAQAANLKPIVVVAGSVEHAPPLVSHEEIKQRISLPDLVLAVGKPDAHPIDSLRAGLACLPADHAFFLWPVDYPFADEALLEKMRGSLGNRADAVIVPVSGLDSISSSESARWGHPVLLGTALVTELNSPAADEGAHHVVRRDRSRITVVQADDPRICANINTPAAARAAGIDS